MAESPLKMSVLIPAHNEAESIAELEQVGIDHEILVVDDASGDGTGGVVASIAAQNPNVRCVRSPMPPGFGHAVRAGRELYTGGAFGTRFGGGGSVQDYPRPKLILNRLPIPDGQEHEIARKVMIKHLQSGNSYGIMLREQHTKFPQPELGPWVENSRTVGTDYQPPVLAGWEPPVH